MKQRILTLSLTAILLLAQIARAQDDSPRFSLTDLRTLNIRRDSLYDLALSPDGAMIAYDDVVQGFCIYHFDSTTTICTPLSHSISSVPFKLVWSPNSATITFTAGSYESANDSDIWILDVNTHIFANLTDEDISYYDSLPPSEDFRANLNPQWSTTADDLYFVRLFGRHDVNGQNAVVLTLYRLRIADKIVKPVSELLTDFASAYGIWLIASSISPDDTHLIMSTVKDDLIDSRAHGIWLIALRDGTTRQVASNSALRVGLPRAYESQGLNPYEIVWLPDDSGLAIRMTDGGFEALFREMVVFLDPTTGHIAPLMNFRNFPLDNPYEPDANGSVPFQTLPVTGMLTPDGRYYFYLTLAAGKGTVWAVSLEHPGDPMLVGTVENAFCNPTPLVISEDGARKYLFTISVCGGE